MMAKEHKRTYETVMQTIDLKQAPGHNSLDHPKTDGISKGDDQPRRYPKSFLPSRETILRLIEWFKDE
jgi:hypothetical protein